MYRRRRLGPARGSKRTGRMGWESRVQTRRWCFGQPGPVSGAKRHDDPLGLGVAGRPNNSPGAACWPRGHAQSWIGAAGCRAGPPERVCDGGNPGDLVARGPGSREPQWPRPFFTYFSSSAACPELRRMPDAAVSDPWTRGIQSKKRNS